MIRCVDPWMPGQASRQHSTDTWLNKALRNMTSQTFSWPVLTHECHGYYIQRLPTDQWPNRGYITGLCLIRLLLQVTCIWSHLLTRECPRHVSQQHSTDTWPSKELRNMTSAQCVLANVNLDSVQWTQQLPTNPWPNGDYINGIRLIKLRDICSGCYVYEALSWPNNITAMCPNNILQTHDPTKN